MERSQGSGSAACVRFWRWGPEGQQRERFPKGDRPFRLMPATRKGFLVAGICFAQSHAGMGPEGVQGAIGKPPGRLRRGEILCDTGRKGRPFSCLPQKAVSCGRFRPRIQGWAPKGSRGRSESFLVASAEAKSFVIWEKKGRPFFLPSTSSLFLWEVSSACGRTRYFPSLESTQRCRGRPKVHGTWPPRTPVAKQQCAASLAGRAQRSSHPVPGRLLPPSAQSIPPASGAGLSLE